MSPALEAWKNEIEALSGGVVVVVPVETDSVQNVLRIPPAFAGRAVIAQLLGSESFVVQLLRAQALNVNALRPEGTFHFILLNMARSADWKDMEDLVLAHEFGHVWLNAMGYRSPDFGADPEQACLATHAGDIIQHILIREEAKRRGFDIVQFWVRVHEQWLEQNEVSPAPSTSRCERWQATAEWLDAVQGAVGWPQLARYETMMRNRFPQLAEPAAKMRAVLQNLDLWDRSLYEYAVQMLTNILLTIA